MLQELCLPQIIIIIFGQNFSNYCCFLFSFSSLLAGALEEETKHT
jgi:hypothetical protein